MTIRKKNFSTDEKKFGFLKVCRSQLTALLGKDKEQSLLAKLLLYIQCHVFFKQGDVRVGKNTYTCFPGQWITSHLQLSLMSDASRKKVKQLLDIMQAEGWITVERLSAGIRISLNGYAPPAVASGRRRRAEQESYSVSDADSFYSTGYVD